MKHQERIYFEKLKEEIALRYREKNAEAPERIEEWGVKTIAGFQEHLQEEVKSAISTRWFYSHIKEVNEEKIPRVDVLDLLSKYAGHDSWRQFVNAKKKEGLVAEAENVAPPEIVKEESPLVNGKPSPVKRKKIALLLIVGCILIPVAINRMLNSSSKMISSTFCFMDKDLGGKLSSDKIRITVLGENESPKTFKCDSSGCFVLRSDTGKIRFVVNAEYYHPDTIVRRITESTNENIRLRSDDYARMISIFSRSDLKDYDIRHKELEVMFTPNAQIFQIDPATETGMEMFNREEFINKLTMPLSSLKNIEVIETTYTGEQISELRFVQREK